MSDGTSEPILIYNGEPIAHGCIESRSELLERAWEEMGYAGFARDMYGSETHDSIRDFDDFLSYFDCHAGMEQPITDIYDCDDEPVSIIVLNSPFYTFELRGDDWFGYDGDEMQEAVIQYCQDNGIEVDED